MIDTLFRQAEFVTSASELAQLPPDPQPEVAFAGRSNVGKSSVINALAGNRRLARTSGTPGRTRLINFFSLGPGHRIVDLPGYGFARVPAPLRRHWAETVSAYLSTRPGLRGVVVVVDARRPLTPLDRQMLEWSGAAGLPVHLVLNKSDKLSAAAAHKTLQEVERELAGHAGALAFSARTGLGVAALREIVAAWLGNAGRDRRAGGKKKAAPVL